MHSIIPGTRLTPRSWLPWADAVGLCLMGRGRNKICAEQWVLISDFSIALTEGPVCPCRCLPIPVTVHHGAGCDPSILGWFAQVTSTPTLQTAAVCLLPSRAFRRVSCWTLTRQPERGRKSNIREMCPEL